MTDVPEDIKKAARECAGVRCFCRQRLEAEMEPDCEFYADGDCSREAYFIECAILAERERCANVADDLQYSADATFNNLTARARKGEKHLEFAAATAAGMSHQARKAAAAIRIPADQQKVIGENSDG